MHRGAARELALRLALVAGGAALLGAVHVPRPATLCPARAMTGIPCPICGTTTALVRLGRLDVVGAFLANPVTLSALLALAVAPALVRRARLPVVLAAVAAAEFWQLARFDVI